MKIVLLPGLDGTGILFKPFVHALPSETDIQIISYPPNAKLNYQELTELVMSQLSKERTQDVWGAEGISGRVKFLPLAWAGMPKTSFRKNSDSPLPNYIIKLFLFGSAVNIKLIRLFKQSMKQVSPQILSYRLQEIEKLSNSPQFSEIRATYIQATNDKLVPKRCVENFEKRFNNLNVFEIEGSHFILQGNPLACAEVIANEITL